jgi:VCBS repeat-containing protein
LQEGKDKHESIHDDDLSSASSVLSSSDEEDSDGELDDKDAKTPTKQAPPGGIKKKRNSPRASASSASSRMSARKKIKTDHFSPVKNDGRKRPGRAPPSRRSTKTHVCDEKESDGQPGTKAHPKTNQGKVKHPASSKALTQSPSDVMTVLQQLLEQQSQLISMMHDKCTNDNKVTADSAATGVSALTATKQSRDAVGATSCNGRYQEILPRVNGEHDMAQFMRHSLDVAQLIEENAMLRKEKLISDMLHGPSKH